MKFILRRARTRRSASGATLLPDCRTRVLVVFATVALYGMERAVIELFDAVRPEVEATFILPTITVRNGLPVFSAIKERELGYHPLNDPKGWPRLGKPRSVRQFWHMLYALVRGNIDVLQSSQGQDVIYVPGLGHMYFALLAAALFRFQGKRVIFAFHDVGTRYPLVFRLVTSLATDVVYHSDWSADAVQKKLPFLRSRHNAVIANVIQIPQSFAASIPPLSEAERHIVFAGQVAPHKGVDLLVDAFASLAQDYPDVDLHIIGGSADATFSEYLRQRATAEHAAGRVHFWGFREDVHGLMKQAYVFVQPSRPSVCQETFGRGVVEAMGLGVPSIVLRSGALQELVRHGETGLICDDESVPALAQCLRTFLDNTELRERCADQARQLYVSAYAPHPLANRWRAFLAVAQ